MIFKGLHLLESQIVVLMGGVTWCLEFNLKQYNLLLPWKKKIKKKKVGIEIEKTRKADLNNCQILWQYGKVPHISLISTS